MAINFDSLVPQLDNDAFDQTIIDPIEESIEPTPEDTASEEDLDNTEEDSIESTAEIEPTVEDTTEDSIEDDTNSESKGNEVATLFYQELVDRGIAAQEDGKTDYTWEDVNNVLDGYSRELPEQVADQIISSTPEYARNLIDYVFTKGENLSKEDLKNFYNQYLDDLDILESNTDFTDASTARDFLAKEYKAQGFRDAQIEVLLDTLEDESEETLKAEAKKYADKRKESLKTKEILNEEKENLRSSKEELREFSNKITEELTSTGWKASRINKVKQELFNGRTNEVLSRAAKHPKALIQLANLATYFDEKTGEFNFKDFILQTTSEDAKGLRDKIKKDMFSSGSTTRGREANPNRSKLSDLTPISPLD